MSVCEFSSIVFSGLDTTEIGCCGAAFRHLYLDDHRLHGAWTATIDYACYPGFAAATVDHHHPGCYFLYPEAGIRCFAANSNTCRRHLRLLDCRRLDCYAAYCRSRRDPSCCYRCCCCYCSHDGPCRTLTGLFGISESIELTF